MNSFGTTCQTLRRQGLTINEISRKTGKNKSSIYQYICKIPLSASRQREIASASAQRIIDFNHTRKGKSDLGRSPIRFDAWTPARVALVGHLIFDGEIKHMGCVYTNRCRILHNEVISAMNEIYPFPPKKAESLPGVFKSCYYNVELSAYLKQKTEQLLSTISEMDKKLQLAFLRAFFDDEGSVYFIGVKRAVRGFQHSHERLMLIQKLLMNFGIESRVDIKYNEIVVSRKNNIEKFAKEINFTRGLCVNGNRSNSVWKKSLEKREILRRAIASYK